MTTPIIRATGLTKQFGDFTAVDNLSIEVQPGSIFAFLGANGSGKSTTIRMLIGLLEPTAGSVEVDGIDVITNPRRVRDHIGYMGQKVSLYHGLTLRENVEFYAGLHNLSGNELTARWGSLRERFEKHADVEEDVVFPKLKRSLTDEELDVLGEEIERSYNRLLAGADDTRTTHARPSEDASRAEPRLRRSARRPAPRGAI